MKHYDVAVVGYGPTGLMLAALLAQAGHRILVLERWPQLYGRARLTHIDGETVRLLSMACDIDHAMRDSSPIASFKFYNAKGRELLDVSAIPVTPMGHADHNSIFQPHIEDALDARVKSLANATVLQGHEVTGIVLANDKVTLSYRTPGGTAEQASAGYVVGTDGANSFVRETLGIERDDSGFNERWLNIDGVYDGTLAPIYRQTVQHCDPERGRMSMPIGKDRRRFEFGLKPGETAEEMESDETIARLLTQYFNVDPAKMRIDRKVIYHFQCRTAKHWRKGRALLAGDAAHTMPPYLGQGACSGIRDAANLAWKLGLVLRARAPETILGTYETERRPHVTHIQKAAVSFGKVANTHSKIAAFIRDIVFRLNILPAPPPFPPLGPGVKQEAAGKAFVGKIGDVPPHGKVRIDGRTDWFDSFAGYAFSLIAKDDALTRLTPAQHAFLKDLGCNLFVLDEAPQAEGVRAMTDLDGRFGSFLAAQSCQAMILRPDTNLFGLAETAAELPDLVDALRARLGWRDAVAVAA